MPPRAAVAPVALLLLSGLTACTADDRSGPSPTPPAPIPSVTASPSPSAAGTSGTTELTVTYRPAPGAAPQAWRLTCGPAGGTLPDPERACAVLAENGSFALPPVGRQRMCTGLYDGPGQAAVTGRWQGRPVEARFVRTNGCEISRWDALRGLLPAAGTR